MTWPLAGAHVLRGCDTAPHRAILTERARFVRGIDAELRVACRTEAAARLELGVVAREILRRRTYRRLGFVRLADYARERLGLSARSLQAAAWVATRLEALPIIAAAFARSDLSWAQVRALCALAAPDDQEAWLSRARRSTVEALERAAASRREGADADPDADDGLIDGEPLVRIRLACPSRVRALWRRAVELASQVAGEALPVWRATEHIAAEAFSGRPAAIPFVDRAVLACLRLARRARRAAGVEAREPSPAAALAGSPQARPATAPPAIASTTAAPDSHPIPSDPFALDRRALAAVLAIRTCEPKIGRLLRIIVDHRVYRAHGFGSFAAYTCERLGISARKAWALLKVERSTRRGDAFARAYETGAISWVQALTLLPVVERSNAAAWVARAQAVTVRRLTDEVRWVLERHDLAVGDATLGPPPLDDILASPAALAPPLAAASAAATAENGSIAQIGAPRAVEGAVPKFATPEGARIGAGATLAERATLEVSDAEIQFSAPASVVALFRETLDVFARPGEPRWAALAHALTHVIGHWESTPAHRDPIFARDGWRCAVPGCSSRRNLHDHHLRYRSQGGDDAHENRVTVCAAHHLHGIHGGVIRAWGTAPRDVHWELGLRAYEAPLLTYIGDRRCGETTPARVMRHGGR